MSKEALTEKELVIKKREKAQLKANQLSWDELAANLKAWKRSPTVPEINRSNLYLLGNEDNTSTPTSQ